MLFAAVAHLEAARLLCAAGADAEGACVTCAAGTDAEVEQPDNEHAADVKLKETERILI